MEIPYDKPIFISQCDYLYFKKWNKDDILINLREKDFDESYLFSKIDFATDFLNYLFEGTAKLTDYIQTTLISFKLKNDRNTLVTIKTSRNNIKELDKFVCNLDVKKIVLTQKFRRDEKLKFKYSNSHYFPINISAFAGLMLERMKKDILVSIEGLSNSANHNCFYVFKDLTSMMDKLLYNLPNNFYKILQMPDDMKLIVENDMMIIEVKSEKDDKFDDLKIKIYCNDRDVFADINQYLNFIVMNYKDVVTDNEQPEIEAEIIDKDILLNYLLTNKT